MNLHPDGGQLFASALAPSEVQALRHFLIDRSANTRVRPGSGLAPLLGPADALARHLLGAAARPVGAKYFDKSPDRNWALGWHQDRTVPVRERRDVRGFSRWTFKAGIAHCVPPFEYLARSLTLRLHLDEVGEANAPLLVAPRSHRLGPIAEREILAAVERCGTLSCEAAAGDIWAYATLILHASPRAAEPARRRVLQILYSAEDLPGGLEWAGI
ncbi:MAG TPA: phytanoyl-CoA dioxygenase family protein [Allosphingosinicella sp.]|nr:phytanoyl-CoA dioxygenase family protein [Allosphingosinicella sp.]